MTDQPIPTAVVCPRCRRTSYSLADVTQGYCAACHDWTNVGADGRDRRYRPHPWARRDQ